jgi:integrase
MPTLIKRTGSPYFIACFDVPQPDGSIRRLKKSTKQTTRREALKKALELEAAEQKAGTATGETATKAFAILTEAAEAAARGELSEGRARDLISRLCEVSTGSPLKFHTVRTWAQDWQAMKAATTKKATKARYKTHVDAFLAWLGDKADARLEAVTKADIRAFRDAIRTGWTPKQDTAAPKGKAKAAKIDPAGRTAATTNNHARDIAGMFRAAVREGLLLASPAAALDRLPELDSTEREVFTVAEVGQLVTGAGDPQWATGLFTTEAEEAAAARCADWQGVILAGFYAGARLGDCARLTWGNVNLARKTLSFMPAKTERKRKRLEVPIHPRLMSWLKRRTPGTDAEPLFPALYSAKVGGQHGLSSQFIAIMDAAKIDRRTVREGTKGGQRAQHARSFHALRHSLTSTLANADVSEEIRRRIVGHESAAVHSGYTHHERETLARAVEKMPNV